MRLIDADNLKVHLTMEASVGYVKTLEDVEKIIDFVPTINPEDLRTKGKWKFAGENYEAWTHRCSECGEFMTTKKGRLANFCPNCGAKMEG